MLKLEHPTLAELNKVIRMYERVNATTSALDDTSTQKNTTVNQVKQRSNPPRPAATKQPQSTQPQTTKPGTSDKPDRPRQCFACGSMAHVRTTCPLKDAACSFCNKKGHQEPVCRTKLWKQAAQSTGAKTKLVKASSPTPDSEDSSDDNSAHTARIYHRVSTIRQYSRDTPRLEIEVRGRKCQFHFKALPDTGATRSIISLDLVQKHNIPYQISSDKLYAADDSQLKCEGFTTLWVNGVKIKPLVSSSIINEFIICWHNLVEMDVLPADFPSGRGHKFAQINTKDTLDSIITDFSDILTDELPPLPMTGCPMRIELDESKRIYTKKVETCKELPVHWEKEARQYIEQLLKDDVIEEVHEDTTDWVSPAFFVAKPNGKLRLVTDFTRLNKYVKRPVHPFPSATEIVQRIPAGTKIFAKLDAVQGYHQVPLAEDCRHLTTFLLPFGKYRYKRGPMGLRSTNDVFCAKSDRTIKGIPHTQKIVDDILVCAKNDQELFSRMRAVLLNCRKFNIAISKRKLTVGDQIEFAGFTLTPSGVTPSLSLIHI